MAEPIRHKIRNWWAPIILAEPQLGENIGFAARAMMNGGLSDLRIVKPRDGWPTPRRWPPPVRARSFRLRVFTKVRQRRSATCSVAMTARPREMVKPVATPRNAVSELRHLIDDGHRAGLSLSERKGLDNDDVALADMVVQAPLNPAHSSIISVMRDGDFLRMVSGG